MISFNLKFKQSLGCTIAILLLLFASVGYANSSELINPRAANSPSTNNEQLMPLTLLDEHPYYVLLEQLVYLEDHNYEYSFEEIHSNSVQQKFQSNNENQLSLGYMKTSLWLHFTIDPSQTKKNDWLLIFDFPLLDEIDIYSRSSKAPLDEWQHVILGDSKPFSKRLMDYRKFVVPLNIADKHLQEFYVRINTSSSMQVMPFITSSEAFFTSELKQELFYGILYGVMLLMVLYNIFMFVAVKDVSYFVYVISVLSGCVFIMTLNGHAYQYLWPNSPKVATISVAFSASIWMTSTALFTHMFLETKQYAPRLYPAIKGLIVAGALTTVYNLFGDYQLAIKLSITLAILNGGVILLTSIYCGINGNRYAKFFTIAWIFYGAGSGLLIVSRLGGLEHNFVTHNSIGLGLVIQIIMLTLALSVKFRVLTEELNKHTQELETKVLLRTQALEASNKKLERLSTYDALTGIPNRRYFDEQFEKEWVRAKREQSPISILICDIDEFKNINDHFGHQYGDECLQRIAKVLLNVLHRPADMPARFGGDEFVVILPGTLGIGAELIAINICEEIENLMLKQAPDAMQPIVTLSIGCASLIPSANNDIKALFALADKNLFKAKEKGRNCVVSSSDVN